MENNTQTQTTGERDAADIAGALGLGDTVEYRGKIWQLKPLDVFDSMELMKRYGGLENVDVDTDVEQFAYVAYLMLRKADPDLTDPYRRQRIFRLTVADVAALFSIDDTRGMVEMIAAIKLHCGLRGSNTLVADDEPDEPKNAPRGTAKRQPRPRTRGGVSSAG